MHNHEHTNTHHKEKLRTCSPAPIHANNNKQQEGLVFTYVSMSGVNRGAADRADAGRATMGTDRAGVVVSPHVRL